MGGLIGKLMINQWRSCPVLQTTPRVFLVLHEHWQLLIQVSLSGNGNGVDSC